MPENNPIFPKGEKANPDYFTGTAWVNALVSKDETNHFTIVDVVFEPGCRNNWHTHPAGQILLITDGKGLYQERDKQAKTLSKGDVIVIPSDVKHWHGAIKHSSLTHIAVTNIGKMVQLIGYCRLRMRNTVKLISKFKFRVSPRMSN